MFEGSLAEKLVFLSFEASVLKEVSQKSVVLGLRSTMLFIYLSIFLSFFLIYLSPSLSLYLSLSLSISLSLYLSISTSKSGPNMVCFVHVDSLSLSFYFFISLSLCLNF